MGFIHDEFLLKNETAKRLYHSYAEKLPIIDYHCHINPREIAEDKKFEDITEIWLGGDHYKWRLIRMTGAPESEITGKCDPRVKFSHFAEALPLAIGNPMYHWTHLELKRYFDCDLTLSPDTADMIFSQCNEALKRPDMSARGIIKKSNVKMIGTTDDPIDSLEWHEKIAADKGFETMVLPSFRPDKAVNIDKAGFAEYIKKLGEVAGVDISTAAGVMTALTKRLEYFCAHGCKAADHGLDYAVYSPAPQDEVERIFASAMRGETVSQADADKYKTAILVHIGRDYARLGVVMQLHYNCQRCVNSRYTALLGPDTGFDCIRSHDGGAAVTGLLNALDVTGELPKTVLYSLNPADNELLDTIAGSFPGEGGIAKVQHGAAWWFNDTKSGMEEQLKSFANLGMLGGFIGMLTDSRSFLSYTRHEYFRRIFCNLIGEWVENGEYPADEVTLKRIVEGVCYYNAAKFFGIE